MIKLNRKLDLNEIKNIDKTKDKELNIKLSLTIDQRIRSRLRVELSNGEEAALDLPRGGILRDGDWLSNTEGFLVKVVSANEQLSVVRTDDPFLRARICYHLGNRHVPLEIAETHLSYQHDHVLDEMVRGLGAQVKCEQLPFEPEAGAYGGHSQGHHHSH